MSIKKEVLYNIFMDGIYTILVIFGTTIACYVLVNMIPWKNKSVLPGPPPNLYATNLPENVLYKELVAKAPIGFVTNKPIVKPYSDNNEYVKVIELTEGTGYEYVQKVGKDNLQIMYDKLYKKPFYEKWISQKKKNQEVSFFINKIKNSPNANSIIKFYTEMAIELASEPDIKEADMEMINSNKNLKKWFDFVIMLDVQLEAFVWLYIYLTKDLHIPKYLVDYFGNIGKTNACSFLTANKNYTQAGNNIIGRNFDWMSDSYDGIPVYVFKHKQFGVTNIGFPGMVFSTLTAINKEGVWCSFNNLSYSLDIALKDKVPPVVIEMFFKLKDSKTANELYTSMLETDYDINIMYFTGDTNGTYCVAQKVEEPINYKVTEFNNENNIAARANKVIVSIWYHNKLAHPKAWASDSLGRQTIMMKQLEDNKGKLTTNVMCHILQEPLYTNPTGPTLYKAEGKNADHTVYQCVYEPYTKSLLMRGNSNLKQNQPWIEINLNKYYI